MSKSAVRCPECNRLMKDVGGLGESSEFICSNIACPTYYKHITCSKCGSNDKRVEVLGLGHQQFTCNKCGNEWEEL